MPELKADLDPVKNAFDPGPGIAASPRVSNGSPEGRGVARGVPEQVAVGRISIRMESDMQIAPGIYSMSQEQGGHVHAFLLDDGNGLTLLDTLYDDDGKGVLAEISRIGKTPADLKTVILTHAHKSHLGGLAALKKASGATVCSHDWEVDIIAGRREATRVSPIPRRPLQVYSFSSVSRLAWESTCRARWIGG